MIYKTFEKFRELFLKERTGIYRHFKGGYYEVFDLGFHTESEDILVMYRDVESDGPVFLRPYHIFYANVEGTMIPRFTRVDEKKT